MRMRGLNQALLWLLYSNIVTTFPNLTTCTDICSSHDGSGRPNSICSTPYCKCNNPYGRVYCSCIPQNETVPLATQVTLQQSGPCSLPQETRKIEVTDCHNVTFVAEGFNKLRNLNVVNVTNVREVTFASGALHWNASNQGLQIYVTNATIAHLPSHTFGGRVSRIVFTSVYLGLIKAYAFSSMTETERIQFVDCNFANAEQQSFKHFSTKELLIDNSRFHVVPGRFIHEVKVEHLFRLEGNSIDLAKTMAFHMSHPTETIISRNRFSLLEGEAFSVLVRGHVKIEENRIEIVESGAFKGIAVDKRVPFALQHDLVFDNNTLGSFNEASMMFSPDFQLRFSNIHIDDQCTCTNVTRWRNMFFPLKTTQTEEAHLEEIWCHRDSRKELDFDFISGELFYENHCSFFIKSVYFIAICLGVSAVGLCVIVLVCFFVLKRRHQWDTVPTTDVNGVTNQSKGLVMPEGGKRLGGKGVVLPEGRSKKGIVVPDGRVYRETEFHVIVEKAEPMEEVTPYQVTRDRSKINVTRVALT